MLVVSQGAEALTGHAPEALLHSREIGYASLIHPPDRQKVAKGVETADQAAALKEALAPTEAPAPSESHGEPAWLAYINRHGELMREDARQLIPHLSQRSAVEAMQLARRHVEAWAPACRASTGAVPIR